MNLSLVWKLFAVAIFLLWLAPASAQPRVVCGPYDDMVRAISGIQYQEVLGGLGIVVTAGWRLELWYADHDRRSWSILAVQTSGHTCLISHGVDWEHILPGEQAQPRD
jgi:hypothetical protein